MSEAEIDGRVASHGVHCPRCDLEDTRVVDSRLAEGGAAVRRRRRCERCDHRFTTFERPEPVGIVVAKSDGRTQPFDPAKIAAGVRAATKGRSVTDAEIEQLASSVEDELRSDGGEVTSGRIGIAVLERLRDLDEVAYVRFASVYKHFDGAADFATELALLRKTDRHER